MSADSAQELKAACDVLGDQLADHHVVTSTLKGEVEGHLATWFDECAQWIRGEAQHVHDEYEHLHRANLQSFIDWLEHHSPVVRLIGQKALDLFNEVIPESALVSVGAAVGVTAAPRIGPLGAQMALAHSKPMASTSLKSKTWVTDMAELSKAVEHKDAKLPAGFIRIDSNSATTHDDYGLFAYKKPDGSIGYVCAFGGTEGNADTGDDIIDWAGIPDAQYENAVAYAQHLSGQYGAANVTYTGHSLGGGLASVASMATGSRAVTFNASRPGFGDLHLASDVGGFNLQGDSVVATGFAYLTHSTHIPASVESRITDFTTPDDPLSNNEVAVGTHVQLQGADPFRGNPLDVKQAAGHDHGLDHVIASIAADTSTHFTQP